ncbi:glycosyltransferase family 4 protein [Vibrio cholerae]|uniref:glycosyltransferase family 4 protein n=1 Tax=Vibrio cholerae TaxID=666 RepID=UPI001158A609|nr:glycosyltransferase family 4 protein [Vibrio cholerae]TQP52303.1 glycosyltransferase family 4 protein [Vibrio cholerae]TQP86645.1 glycosyltransferase family 4 protein [Vibrio cholerae]
MLKKKKIIFVSEYLGLECNSTAYYWTKILESLKKNFDILVVVPSSQENISYLTKAGFNYVTYKHCSFRKSNMFSRLIAYMRMCISMNCVVSKFVEKDDIVVSGTNPIFNLLYLSILKKKVGFSWVLFAYDIFPENLVPANIIRAESPLYILVKMVFSKLYCCPTEIIAVGRDMQLLLREKINNKIPVHYVPNWADHDDTFPVASERENDSVVFQFFGNMGRLQDIENILKAIPLVKSSRVMFSFVGDGGESEKVKCFISNMNDSRVTFKGPCSMSNRNEALSSCDVALVSLKSGMYGLAVPSKAYFSLAANKPLLVVGDEGAELRLLVEEYNLGWGCDASTPEHLAQLIDYICSRREELSRMNVRDVMIANFSESISLKKISEIFSRF